MIAAYVIGGLFVAALFFLFSLLMTARPRRPGIKTYTAGRNIAQGQLVMRGDDGKAYPMTTQNHDKLLFLGRSETAADLGQDIRIRIEK